MIIETKRLILRPFLESDAADMFEYLREPMVNCFACMRLNSLEEAKAEVRNRIGETEYYFAIVLKDTGKVIGEIDAYPEQAEPHDQDSNSPLDTFSPCWMRIRRIIAGDMHMKRHTPSLIICSAKKAQDAYMHIRRITIPQASAFAKNLVCAGKVYFWNLYLSSITQTAHRIMRTHISMPS